MGTALQELRCESDLSQRASSADVSLLRLYLCRAYSLSGLWRSGTYEPRIRHGKDWRRHQADFSGSQSGPNGLGYHPYPHGLWAYHQRLWRGEDGYSDWHADDFQRTGLRPGKRGRYPECRLDDELSWFPLVRTGVPAHGTSGRKSRTKEQAGTGGASDEVAGESAHSSDYGQRLCPFVSGADGRT